MKPALLVLASGERFEGFAPDWQRHTIFGEVVFNTGMVGYMECLTDPSYSGQLLNFTYPLIGNYGVNTPSEWESSHIRASAMICSEAAEYFSRENAATTILETCREQGCGVLVGADVRAITITLRDKGVVAGAIVPKGQPIPRKFPDVNKQHLVKAVSIKDPITTGQGKKKVIAIDCGMKENIWRYLKTFPIELKRVPFDYDVTQEDFDGLFISNGPGDPMRCVETINTIKKVMALPKPKPIFGICLGSQLMGLAINAKTYKLRFGHRSQNQPCLQLGTDRCYLTSQNHGFAIDEKSLPKGWRVNFRNLNDDSVQGIEHEKLPYFSVQFHPEAAPGPTDTAWLFEKFYKLL